MRRKYNINASILRKILWGNIYLFLGIIMLSPIFVYIKGIDVNNLNTSIIVKILLGIIAMVNLPTIVILINYYNENKKITIQISLKENTLIIIKGNSKNEYELSEIKKSVYYLGVYYKNRIDNAHRWKMINSDLGYWDVTFNNGDRYYLTNLLIDFLHKEPIVKNTTVKYKLFQTIDKSKPKEIKLLNQTKYNSRVTMFVRKYRDKSVDELKEIIANKSKFQKEAVEAAKLIIEKNDG